MSLTAQSPLERTASLPAIQSVNVFGLGYIGLPTAALMASRGLEVCGVDVKTEIVDTINRGQIHITEPALDMVVSAAVTSGRLKAGLVVEPADAHMIAVPTPITDNKTADLTAVLAAADALAPALRRGDLVVLESTSPVGATEVMIDRMARKRPDLRFPKRGGDAGEVFVAYCPERVLPGRVIEELVSNDRAIGGVTPSCTARAISLYEQFVEGELVATDTRSAELCKLAENAFRDVNIAYANELANVCERLDMNVWEVIRLANRHPRVNVLRPGPGVGGHCIAVDPWFIAEAAPEDTPLIRAARWVNDGRPGRIIERIGAAVSAWTAATGREPVVALLGLAFKPNIDDLRESPAVEIAHKAGEAGWGEILLVEPHVDRLPEELDPEKFVLASLSGAIESADILALLVDHTVFAGVQPDAIPGKVVVSAGRDLYERTPA
ncbi:MAG: UDP-N-acetyl-D-mannosamine dehydrogenase [Pseudomonadota bacterium]